MNFRALEKSISVLEKSWKFFSVKGYEPCEVFCEELSSPHLRMHLTDRKLWPTESNVQHCYISDEQTDTSKQLA